MLLSRVGEAVVVHPPPLPHLPPCLSTRSLGNLARHAVRYSALRASATHRPAAHPALQAPPARRADPALSREPDRQLCVRYRCVVSLVRAVDAGELTRCSLSRRTHGVRCAAVRLWRQGACVHAGALPLPLPYGTAQPARADPLPSPYFARTQVRRFVDRHTASFFTLSAQDRQVLSARKDGAAADPSQPQGAEQVQVQPDRRTPVAFFKENPVLGKEGEREVGKDGRAV